MRREIRVATAEDIAWAAQRIGLSGFRNDAKGIAMAKDGSLAAVVVYDCWSEAGCFVHIASDGSKRWATAAYLMEIFAYPFVTANRRRITAFVHERNQESMAMCLHMGFKVEGKLAEAAPDGDMFILGMTRKKCRFISPEWRQ